MSNKMNSLALPEIAIIRKGDAKVKKVKDGREYETVGPDLKDRFRVVFAPGTAEYQKIFETKFHTLKPERIRAMVLSRSVWESWSWANEAYNAGRMIAKADDEHYLVKRNPLTGEYEVKDGEPFTKFEPGQSIHYANHEGKKIELKIRTVGRLRLFLPEMERLVQFTLKTTSYYDRLNIDGQLNSIQTLADTLNNGNAAGIPLRVFRMAQDVVWNKPDGSAQRVQKWLVNIEADSEWVRATTARLSKFALTGETITGLLPPPQEVSGVVEPEPEEMDENPSDAEIFDAEFSVAADTKEQPTEEPKGAQIERPLTPATLRSFLARKASSTGVYEASPDQIGLMVGMMDMVFAPDKDADKLRRSCLHYLWGVDSSKKMSHPSIKAMLDWLKPVKDSGGAYSPDPMAARELKAVWEAEQLAKGQTVLPGLNK